MRRIGLSFLDQSVLVRYPESLHDDLRVLFGVSNELVRQAGRTIVVEEDGSPDRFNLHPDGRESIRGVGKGDCLYALLGEVGYSLVVDLKIGVALHAGAVSTSDGAILIPGPSGSGKSSLTAWFVNNGFEYLTDELVVFGSDAPNFAAFARPLILKGGGVLASLKNLALAPCIAPGVAQFIVPPRKLPPQAQAPCRLIIFPHFAQGESLSIQPLTPAQTGLELMRCNVNARNLVTHGFDIVTSIARSAPAAVLHYGGFEQLDGVLDVFADLALKNDWNAKTFSHFFRSFGTPLVAGDSVPTTFVPSKIPAPTPRRQPRKLTIGMATYDDYDGVYFTVQALRMYHSEILADTEFIVIDNHPDGPCADSLKRLEGAISNYRYVPHSSRSSTAIKGLVFEEANSELVLCMDCHVFIVPGAVKKLIDYFDRHHATKDLLQGPLVMDNLETICTHFEPKWRGGMYGCWATDDRGKDPDAEPFEIPMQGLGLFACRRQAWPGFNRWFHGFGGEEGYLHEKFRRAGGRTLCLPFLRWMHRFNRPMGVPYVNTWNDRLRNYLIGFRELGWDIAPLEQHFAEVLGVAAAKAMIDAVKAEIEELSADESGNRLASPAVRGIVGC